MRILRLVIISVIVLFLVTTFVFALFPSHIRLSRVVNVPASQEKTAAVIGDLRTWNHWNFLSGDTTSGKQTLSVPSYGTGAFLQTGRVRITLTSVGPDSIRCSWERENGPHFAGGFNIRQVDPNNCTVEWYLDFSFSWYPWEKFKSFFYDRQLGPVMESSLVALTKYVPNH